MIPLSINQTDPPVPTRPTPLPGEGSRSSLKPRGGSSPTPVLKDGGTAHLRVGTVRRRGHHQNHHDKPCSRNLAVFSPSWVVDYSPRRSTITAGSLDDNSTLRRNRLWHTVI